MSKEFFTNTLTSARLQKFETLLKGPFFMGDEVRHCLVSRPQTLCRAVNSFRIGHVMQAKKGRSSRLRRRKELTVPAWGEPYSNWGR